MTNKNDLGALTKNAYVLCVLAVLISEGAYGANHSNDYSDLPREGTGAQARAVQNLLADTAEIGNIRALTSDANPMNRKWSVILLQRLKDRTSKDILIRLIDSDPVWLVRERAIISLSDYPPQDAIEVLARASKVDAAVNNRVTALRYLSHIGGDSAVVPLKAALADASDVVKLNSAQELARRGDKSGYTIAKKSLKHPYWAAREAAAATVGFVGSEDDMKDLDELWKNPKEQGDVRYEAFAASHHLGIKKLKKKEQLDHLDSALSDKDWMSRKWAINELVKRDDGSEILERASTTKSHPAQMDATSALKMIRRRE